MDSLSAHEETSYTVVIDAILANCDILTISAKKIRLQLQQGLDRDVTQQKKAINALIQRRFDKFTAEQDAKAAPPAVATNGAAAAAAAAAAVCRPSPPATPGSTAASTAASQSPVKRDNGVKREAAGSASGDDVNGADDDDETPARKKPKKGKAEEDDAAYAAKLQAQLNSAAAARSTRGGGPRVVKAAPKRSTPKAKRKSAAKVTADDDSEVEENGSASKTSKRGGIFNRPMYLSAPLQELLGVETLSRPQTVKGLWAYIREQDLQNPSDKRKIRCDDKLKAIFKKDGVDMFSMNKLLSSHLSPMEDPEQ